MGQVHLADDLESALDGEGVAKLSRGEVPRDLLRPPTVAELLRYTALEWVGMAACWAAMWTLPWWTWPVWAVLVAGRLHALGVILHDAAHMPLRNKPLPVRLLEVAAGFPLMTTLDAMRYHHLRHHRDNGMPSDPYFKPGLAGRPGLYAVQVLRGALLVTFWGTRPIVAVGALVSARVRVAYARVYLQDRSTEDLAASREVLACARADMAQFAALGLVLALAALWPVGLVFGWYLPAILSGLLAAWRLLQEHNYDRAMDRRVETIVATTNDHHLGSWLDRLVLAPRNIGYHVVHHIHPQVGLAHLPALRGWWLAHHPETFGVRDVG